MADKDKQNHKTHSATGKLASVASVFVGFYARNIHFFFFACPNIRQPESGKLFLLRKRLLYTGYQQNKEGTKPSIQTQSSEFEHRTRNTNVMLYVSIVAKTPRKGFSLTTFSHLRAQTFVAETIQKHVLHLVNNNNNNNNNNKMFPQQFCE